MPVQKLIANTTNEGLKRIREEIGSDALILKTVKRNGKVEFFVETEDPLDELEELNQLDQLKSAALTAQREEQPSGLITEYRDAKLKMLSSIASKVDVPVETEVLANTDREPPRQKRQSMQSELTVKNLIEALELTPAIGARLRGFKRIDEVVDNLALMIQPGPAVTEGIHAFVGPAGSGKTTSLVKLITRHIMQHGEDSCAIINCDRFRMGAREQLTRLGELMGVDVLHVGPGLDLNQAIANVHKRRFVAIDMPGLGMQDEQLYTELFRLSSSHYQIQRFLVMPANLQFSAMQLAQNFFAGRKGSNCLLTRLDETSSLGAALSFLVQSAMPLAYTCDGPHIPEDLAFGRGEQLVQIALKKLDGQFAKAEFSDLTNRETFHKQGSYSQEKVMDL
ncbi:MAG: flagellar biosynthesis GTPase FlhF [Candidatus Azotimanducaceae bacterium]|jgi:flagellar biosynthesis GTPase FlhF